MSASLVGSEMCIRDRHKALRPLSALSATERHDHKTPRLPSARSAGRSNCLLYTSDAADDM
eukprot:2834305-Alexandrium_andersonii.AAC.1